MVSLPNESKMQEMLHEAAINYGRLHAEWLGCDRVSHAHAGDFCVR